MQYIITAPQTLHGCIHLPASKSISNRALIINALGKNKEEPQNIAICDDTDVLVQALKKMPPIIDIGAAGTAMRFLTAYLSVTPGKHLLTGSERMKNRPIRILVEALRSLGARITYMEKEGFPPLNIEGCTLCGGKISLQGNVSSQYISALLMIGPTLQDGLTLRLEGEIISKPYIDLTLSLMKNYGAEVQWSCANEISVAPIPYKNTPFFIENDWSAASYWYQLTALSSDSSTRFILPGLFRNSMQGDACVAKIFTSLGVRTEYITENGQPAVCIYKAGSPAGYLEYDFVNQPDLTQTLVVTCLLMQIPFHFTGLQSLKIKETDRIHALISESRKLGFLLKQANDCELIWDGARCAPHTETGIDTYEDHRMAMAFAPAALRFPEIRINHPQVVSKSYPQFWNSLTQVGFKITPSCL